MQKRKHYVTDAELDRAIENFEKLVAYAKQSPEIGEDHAELWVCRNCGDAREAYLRALSVRDQQQRARQRAEIRDKSRARARNGRAMREADAKNMGQG